MKASTLKENMGHPRFLSTDEQPNFLEDTKQERQKCSTSLLTISQKNIYWKIYYAQENILDIIWNVSTEMFYEDKTDLSTQDSIIKEVTV